MQGETSSGKDLKPVAVWGRQPVFPITAAILIVIAVVGLAVWSGDAHRPNEAAVLSGVALELTSFVASADPDVMRIDDLSSVDTSIYAFGSVWAVTSNVPDRFSQGALEAQVVRINPDTGVAEAVLDSPDFEPTFSLLVDELWVKLAHRLVAVDGSGAVIRSIEFDPEEFGDVIAGESHLWVLDFNGSRVRVVDPDDGAIVKEIATGPFPVRPLSAFGHVWIPSVTDGTVTIIDEATLGDATLASPVVSSEQLTDVTAVPGGLTGPEVWVTDLEGELFAITATGDDFGQVRSVDIDKAINRIHVLDDRAFLLATWGRDVLVLDLQTEELIAAIGTEAIPFRALIAHDLVWVAGDGPQEILTAIDPETFNVRAQFPIGANTSNTNGPRTPLAVGDQVWVPNRGDDSIFIVNATGWG